MIALILFLFISLPVSESTACISQAELDAEYEAAGTYEIQVDEYCAIGGE